MMLESSQGWLIFILRFVILVIEKRTEEFDSRLGLPLDFVSNGISPLFFCLRKVLNVLGP